MLLQVVLHALVTSIAVTSQKGTPSFIAASLPKRQHLFRATLRLHIPRQQSTTHPKHSIELSWMVWNLLWMG